VTWRASSFRRGGDRQGQIGRKPPGDGQMSHALCPPFSRPDLAMIGRAAKQGWNVPVEVQRVVLHELRQAVSASSNSQKYRESASHALHAVEAAGWTQVAEE
jgi:hypothetical protein